jgi:hypothetical protein
MSTKHILPLITAYLDGEVSRSERVVIERHIEECAQCRAELVRQTRTISELSHALNIKADAAVLPANMWSRIETRLPKEMPKRARQPRALSQTRPRTASSALTTEPSHWLNHALSFAVLALVVLVMGAVLLSPEVSGTPIIRSTTTETPTPTSDTPAPPTETPTLPVDLPGSGGFTENTVDASALPHYDPIGVPPDRPPMVSPECPDSAATESIALLDTNYADRKVLCIYDMPTLTVGESFIIEMTSATGAKEYGEFQLLEVEGILRAQRMGELNPEDGYAGIDVTSPRHPIRVTLYFTADKEYADWQVEVRMHGRELNAVGDIFASGSIRVTATQPIYYIKSDEGWFDLFMYPLDLMAHPSDHLTFAARGLEPGRSLILALYAQDDATSQLTARYARQITVGEDGSYRVEFVVGAGTPPIWFWPVLDPAAGEFAEYLQGFSIGP